MCHVGMRACEQAHEAGGGEQGSRRCSGMAAQLLPHSSRRYSGTETSVHVNRGQQYSLMPPYGVQQVA